MKHVHRIMFTVEIEVPHDERLITTRRRVEHAIRFEYRGARIEIDEDRNGDDCLMDFVNPMDGERPQSCPVPLFDAPSSGGDK